MTTENLLQKELGPVKFRTWHVPQVSDDAWLAGAGRRTTWRDNRERHGAHPR